MDPVDCVIRMTFYTSASVPMFISCLQ